MKFFLFIIVFSSVFGKKLTLEQAALDSPFKIASLGWHAFFPNENAILIRGQGDKWKEWFKVDLINNDTILFFDSLSWNFYWSF